MSVGDQLLRYLFSLGLTPRNLCGADLPAPLPTRLHALFQPCAMPTLLRHSILKRPAGSIEISINCPSPTPLGLGLGPGLPWVDEPSPGNLRLLANRILTCFIATHTGILTSYSSTCTRIQASALVRTLPYHSRSQSSEIRCQICFQFCISL